MSVSASQVQSAWARAFDKAGSTAILRRISTTAENVDATVLIKPVPMPMRSAEVKGPADTRQMARRFLIQYSDIGDWPLPIKPSQDRLILNGRTMVITIVDDTVHQMNGVIMAIEVEVNGA